MENLPEKKALALEILNGLQHEEDIDEILVHLKKIKTSSENRVYKLSEKMESISQRYHETLKKLAQ